MGTDPGRKAGALVVLVDGELVLYVERGGRTLLTWSDDPDRLGPATDVAGRGRPARLAGPAHRGAGRRRGPAGRRLDPAARGARGRRLRRHPAGTEDRVPEGDTVYRTARLLDRALSGQVLTEDRLPGARSTPPPTSAGGTVVETVSRGKHLLTRIDRGPDRWTLHTHLKMEGAWQVLTPRPALAPPGAPGAGRPRDGRGPRRSASRSASSSCSTARPRTTSSGTSAPTCSAPTGTRTRPSPPARDTRAGRSREALLDQRNLAGIGNMYAAELCFTAGVHPQTPGRRRARPAPAGPAGAPDARAQQGARRPVHDRRPARAASGSGSTAATGRRAAGAARRCAVGDAGAGRTGAGVVLVPVLPARCRPAVSAWLVLLPDT